MSTPRILHNLPATESEPRGVRRFIRWLAGGWRLFRRAPLRLFGLMVLLFVVELLVQLFVPVLGIPLSKWVAAMLAGVYWLALLQLDECGSLRPLRAFLRVGNKWSALAALAMVLLLVYLAQVSIGYLMIGPAAIDVLVFSDATASVQLSNARMGLMFASGIPIATLLMFAAPLLLIDRLPLCSALASSVGLVACNALPMALLAILTMLLVFLAPATFALSVLVTGPWLICVGLVAFRDLAKQPKKAV